MDKLKIIAVICDVGMQNGIEGLKHILIEKDIKPELILDGEFVLFTNKSLTQFKLYGSNDVISVKKFPSKITYDKIDEVAHSFLMDNFKFDKSLKDGLKSLIGKRTPKRYVDKHEQGHLWA